MQKNVFRLILRKVKEIEKTQSLEDFVLDSTNWDERHMLRIREEYRSFAPQMGKVYQDFFDLELADLVDYKKFGEFDGKSD